MIKNLFLFIALMAAPAAAQAADFKTINCEAANGLKLSAVWADRGMSTADTTLGGFSRSFGISYFGIGIYTRLALSLPGQPTAYVYDIYLQGYNELVGHSRLTGVIGQTLYGMFLPPNFPSPLPLPGGFRPIATITCDILR
jgi:hypothetical protein